MDVSRYEAVVEKRWEYYRPRFERFARGGWLSWNWAAFFGTLAWLRYRKLHAWSWAYFFVSLPILFALVVYGVVGGDSCERALAPGQFNAIKIALLCVGLAAFILPAVFANRIYFGHVRALVSQPERRGGVSGVGGALALQAFLVIGVAVAAPNYANYVYRSMVSEGIAMVSAVKVPLAEHVANHKQLPARIEAVSAATSGKYVASLVLERDGTVRAVFGEGGRKLAGRSVSVSPTMRDGRVVEWTCRSADLPSQCLPAFCRG